MQAQGPVSGPRLARDLGVSLATLHRHLKAHPDGWLQSGQASRRRYALRRSVAGIEETSLPVMRIDAEGRAHDAGTLTPIAPEGCHFDLQALGWPVDEAQRDGWWESLPYPILDMRPQGYIGRRYARALSDTLPIPANPTLWSDDDILRVIGRHGADLPGDLVVGQASIERWYRERVGGEPPVAVWDRQADYPALARQAMAETLPASGVGGEFPKFTTWCTDPETGAPTPVIVKFSAPDDGSAVVQRWRDLLYCEHLASRALAGIAGVSASQTRVIDTDSRRFFEIERFDRQGAFGRRPVSTLAAIDPALVGLFSHDWRVEIAALHRHGWLDAAGCAAVSRQWWFGQMIANSDMHPGNLAFRAVAADEQRQGQPRFEPTPAYDMLPMAYAPLTSGEIREPDFDPPMPQPGEFADWQAAAEAAIVFWTTVAETSHIGTALRRAGEANARTLERMGGQIGGSGRQFKGCDTSSRLLAHPQYVLISVYRGCVKTMWVTSV